MERSEEIWRQISIDHIMKLSRVHGKDFILIIQDQFSGMIYLKTMSERKTADQMWQNCKKTAWKLHDYSRKMWTNRETIFMSKTWKRKCQKQRITHHKTIAYHSQTNGQMKRANREIKKYLRKYVNHHQNDWPEYLPMLEFAYNSKKPDRRMFTSFQLVYEETSAIMIRKRIQNIQNRKRA